MQSSEPAFGAYSQHSKNFELRSNHGAALDPDVIEWLETTPTNTSLDKARQKFEKNGYLLVKGLIPREDILDVRQEYFNHLKSTGILEDGKSPREGIFNSDAEVAAHNGIGSPSKFSTDALKQMMIDAHTNPEYLKLLSHPSLRNFVRTFMDWHGDVLLPRTMIRHTVPGGLSTGIHYDQIYLRGGDPQDEFLTAWVPLGDITADGGGLMYLSDSIDLGRRFEADFMERAKGMTDEERVSAFNANMTATGALSMDAHEFYNEIAAQEGAGKHKWLVSNYEAGDVVFFGPWLIHAAAMNSNAKGSIRLSTDLRFYKQGSNIDRRWLNIWTPEDGL